MKALAIWIPASGQLISNSTKTPTKVSETELVEFVEMFEIKNAQAVNVEINLDMRTAVFEIQIFGNPITLTICIDRVTFIE